MQWRDVRALVTIRIRCAFFMLTDTYPMRIIVGNSKGGTMGNSSREVIAKLKTDGWEFDSTTGDHHHFKHPTKPGKVTVPHPVKDIKIGTLKSIERQSGVKLR